MNNDIEAIESELLGKSETYSVWVKSDPVTRYRADLNKLKTGKECEKRSPLEPVTNAHGS